MIRFVVFLLLLAAVLYGMFWAIDRRNAGDPPEPSSPRPRGPLGPDDDESFLRGLDRENLDRTRRRTNDDPPPPPTSQE